MKLLLIKPKEKYEIVSLPKKHSYKDLKRFLEIESPLTVIVRKIDGEEYDIWLDDEGLLKEERCITGACMNARELLVGNLLIARHDEEGNTTGLTDEDIKRITRVIIENKDYLDFMKENYNKDVVEIEYGEWGKLKIDIGGWFIPYGA